jgi:hypothetical protein
VAHPSSNCEVRAKVATRNQDQCRLSGRKQRRISELMHAKLTRRLHSMLVPEALWRAAASRLSIFYMYMHALHIELGDVAAEPGSEVARSYLRRIANLAN